MSNMIKKRVQYSIDEGSAQASDYILKSAGLTPSSLLSILFTQIAKTGEIPVSLKVSPEVAQQAKIIKASYSLPTVVVDTEEKARAFFEDDGGY